MVSVNPAYRRAGIGSQLFEHGLTMIKDQTPNAYIGFSSSWMARSLYEKYGFKVVDWFDCTVQDISETGETVYWRETWPYMTNYWEGHEEEMQVASAKLSGPGRLVTSTGV